ncbi:MAG: hypothetical protein QOK48_316 [Blastocatellia bacterium]|jgi:hypothetical protein|nr:hypothetical protein [Blastocatellia bacterium]
MKTAEVAIEHILTGLLALCAFALPLFSGNNYLENVLTKEPALVGVLGLAYLSGVVFDKLADTVLSPIEQYLRISLVSERLSERETTVTVDDPFPQDELEFNLRGEKNGRVDWMDSLRSRMRTCRGLSVLGAPAAMGLAVFHYQKGVRAAWMEWPHMAVALNLFLIFLSVTIISSRKPIKTKELPSGGQRTKDTARARMMWLSIIYSLTLIISAITIWRVTPLPQSPAARAVFFVCSAVAIWMPIWVWYRITKTYLSFVYRSLLVYRSLPQSTSGKKTGAGTNDAPELTGPS